jgi:bifunctional N-acetylglucosamine-1-phosphate-uridyltransferase/glucosamine-1-phosphate-acetyltransferase GlmU-like protein
MVSLPDSPTAVLVLATGDDDFMNSRTRAKVLHGFAGRTMLDHVLAVVASLEPAATVVLVGERGDQVIEHLAATAPQVVATDDPDRAKKAVLDGLPDDVAVLVLHADAPLISREELSDHALDAAAFRALEPLSAAAAGGGTRVNNRFELMQAGQQYNRRLLERHMQAGVTVVDPATTWVDADVTIDADATLWPAVELRGSTAIGAGASIGPDVSLTDTVVGEDARISRTVAVEARVGARVTIGPFAYLRPGTELADDVHIGTYVELKKAKVGEGTKIPHLSYVGDATIGEQTNIGAATVIVNYDGVEKHHTVIGSHARTGADNMFVAPVEVGDGAYTAAGSVITQDVPPGAMGVARAPQRNVAGWVARKRPGTPAADAAARALEGQED